MDKAALTALGQKYPDRDFIVVSREISRSLHADLSSHVRNQQRHKQCTLFLTTFGGDPNAAYRISRCLRHHYTHVRLVIPSVCKSAGTLIAIVANELAIGDLGELGPLDIQVRKDSELAERSSGLDIIQALEATHHHAQRAFRAALYDIRRSRLSTKLAGEFAAKLAVGVVAPLYAQIDPIRLGEMQRAMRIVHEYGLRLQRYTDSLNEDALEKLVAEYPAHGFVIDRKEAGELFRTVTTPTDEEQKFCNTLWDHLESEADYGPEFAVLPEESGEDDEQVTATPSEQGEGRSNGQNGSVVRRTSSKANGQGGKVRRPSAAKANV
ncbi:hypothetical protein ISJ10_09310 [Burkholderia pseudomallei]|nr:hypothetical protein CNX72_19830 [Burkholderia pseudomallei]MBF3778998.1 hypothetical protein [Burkholderia pseudomallei]MBF4060258.1 hypothetical protein [Burkholderia pseudomallei]MBF4078356.1 hypothetical protein [Burkholderia pseudomallei]